MWFSVGSYIVSNFQGLYSKYYAFSLFWGPFFCIVTYINLRLIIYQLLIIYYISCSNIRCSTTFRKHIYSIISIDTLSIFYPTSVAGLQKTLRTSWSWMGICCYKIRTSKSSQTYLIFHPFVSSEVIPQTILFSSTLMLMSSLLSTVWKIS